MTLEQIAEKYGVPLEQLQMGIDVEKEHDDGSELDVVKSKVDLVKIALAHLKEDPEYYTKLNKIENESKTITVLDLMKIIKEEIVKYNNS